MPESRKDVFDRTRGEWVIEALRLGFRAFIGGCIAGTVFLGTLLAVYGIVRSI